ncbi:ABC transporter permease [Petralouisia muris]|uniref:ABC transporter permease n=1 Tax=Petralouisia muris TaxID=3032872 RepID=A0AC61RY96_9FIRM|nr:ABC transporter permease subunit [Petralouisia muris]TGY96785.1 ABC transporter permease [Petralouisia muris]
MKSNMMTVMKKELTRFFTDRRMVLTTLLMPGIMIYLLYSLMGQGFSSQYEDSEDFKAQVQVEALPESMRQIWEQDVPLEYAELSGAQEKEEALEALSGGEGEYHLVVSFPEDFDAKVAKYQVSSGLPAPAVEIYYNSSDTDSQSAYGIMTGMLDSYESALANKFDINPEGEDYDLASEEDLSAQVFSMMVPMLMMAFLFSGCMAIAPESIAGEKERGTIATLLVTPLKRSHLALGKVVSLSIIAILCGLSSFLGMMLSLPKLMGDGALINANVYGFQDYLLLLLVILSTVLVIVAVVSIVSAFAKNVKEATGWVTPIMIVSMLLGVTSMVESLCKTEPMWFLIPLYNSVQCMNGIFSLKMDMVNLAVTVASNVFYAGIGVVILTKMFDSEKVMFSK